MTGIGTAAPSSETFVPHMTIQSGGNVGIGTTEPSAKLHVMGNLKVGGEGPYYVGEGGGNPVRGIEGSWGDEVLYQGVVLKLLKLAPSYNHNAYIGLSQWNNTKYDTNRGIYFWDPTNLGIRIFAKSYWYCSSTRTVPSATDTQLLDIIEHETVKPILTDEQQKDGLPADMSNYSKDISEISVAAGILMLRAYDRISRLEQEVIDLKSKLAAMENR